MKKNFDAVSQTDGFLSLDPDFLVGFFEDDDLLLYRSSVGLRGRAREELILRAVFRYLSNQPSLDDTHVCKLMETVRLPVLHEEDVDKHLLEFKALKKDTRITPFLSLGEKARHYLDQRRLQRNVPMPDGIPEAWLRRRTQSLGIVAGTGRYAAEGEIASSAMPPKARNTDPDQEISKIQLWIRRWDVFSGPVKRVIGAMRITYRSELPVATLMPSTYGSPATSWEHHVVELDTGEHIARVIVGLGWVIDRLTFITTFGRSLGPFGGADGSEYSEDAGSVGFGYLQDIACDVANTEGATAIYNLQFHWLVE